MVGCLTGNRKLFFGTFLLLVVNFIWVASSELSHYIYNGDNYNKPYFTTYIKTSLFSIYLLGFFCYEPWRLQCKRQQQYFSLKNACMEILESFSVLSHGSLDGAPLESFPGLKPSPGALYQNMEDEESDFEVYYAHPLSDPVYVPIRVACTPPSSSCSSGETTPTRGHVKFSSIVEVRNLSDCEESRVARMSYNQGLIYKKERMVASLTLTVWDTMRVALTFCFVWFVASWAYGEALSITEPSVVNIISSTSGIFVCILAALFPSSSSDNFTFSKFAAASLSVIGVVFVTMASAGSGGGSTPSSESSQLGVVWSLVGAFGYAVYLVTLKHQVGNEENIDIPLFFGFVGLFAFLLLWPGIYFCDAVGWEKFELPDWTTLGFITLNGIVGTVLSEFLWLWGCFLTSSLAGTLSLSMTTPLTMLADMLFRGERFSWQLYVGIAPILLSFFAVTLFQHYNNWDPIGDLLVRAVTTSRTRARGSARPLGGSSRVPVLRKFKRAGLGGGSSPGPSASKKSRYKSKTSEIMKRDDSESSESLLNIQEVNS